MTVLEFPTPTALEKPARARRRRRARLQEVLSSPTRRAALAQQIHDRLIHCPSIAERDRAWRDVMGKFEDQARRERMPVPLYNNLSKALAGDFRTIERSHRDRMDKLVSEAATLPWLEESEEEHSASVLPIRYPATEAAQSDRSDAVWAELGA